MSGGETVRMREGELWWFDNKQYHESHNESEDWRIHYIFGHLASGGIVRSLQGLVTPTGQLVEAHSLQRFDPNSEAALKDATAIDFAPSMPAGAPPQQHFAFVIEEFVSRE